jgi:hypothetical protein
VRQWQVAAGLVYGQVKKCYRRRKLVRVTHVMRLGARADLTAARPRIGLLGSAEHGFYRTGESDGASWCLSSGTPHLGHFSAASSTLGSCGMVARLLSFRAFPQSAASGIRTAPRARWPTSGTTLSPAYSGHGSGQNEPTLDSGRGPLLSLAAGPMLSLLRALEARRSSVKWQRRLSEAESRWGGERHAFTGVGRIIHHVQCEHHNHLWGAERIRGELLKLGLRVSLPHDPEVYETCAHFKATRADLENLLTHMLSKSGPATFSPSWISSSARFSPSSSLNCTRARVIHVGVTRYPTDAWTTHTTASGSHRLWRGTKVHHT